MTNQQIYKLVDLVAGELRIVGYVADADLLLHLLYEVPWNSADELLRQIDLVLKDIRGRLIPSNAHGEIVMRINECITAMGFVTEDSADYRKYSRAKAIDG